MNFFNLKYTSRYLALLLVMIGIGACSVAPPSNKPQKTLISDDAEIFDKRFREVALQDINLQHFWLRRDETEERDAIPLNSKTYSDLLEQVKGAVVNIYTLRLEEHDVRFGLSPNDLLPLRIPLLSSLIDIIPFQVPIPYQSEGFSLGSGFIINPEGYILTNAHVISNSKEIRVVLSENKREYPAKIIGMDPITDIALIKAETGFPLQALPFGNSDSLRVGELVIAIGNPLGLTNTMTSGLISAKQRVIPGAESQILDFLQTDSAINPGNSGGPLINIYGEVVGINTAIITEAQLVGFAIPIDTVKEMMPLLVTGKTERGWLGASGIPLSADDAVKLNYPKAAGILVKEVVPKGPADQSGLKPNDIIVELNGQTMDNFLLFRRKLLGLTPGHQIALTVFREGDTLTLDATLSERPKS